MAIDRKGTQKRERKKPKAWKLVAKELRPKFWICLLMIIWVISSAKSNSPRCSVANGEFANVHDWWLVYADLHLDSYGFSWFAKSADVQQVSFDCLPEKQDIIEREKLQTQKWTFNIALTRKTKWHLFMFHLLRKKRRGQVQDYSPFLTNVQ